MNSVAVLNLNSTQVKQIAKNLQNLMKHKNMTECDLARSLKLPVMTVRRIVSGETMDPRVSTLTLFANFFQVTIDALVREHNDPYGYINHQPKFVPIFEWEQVENQAKFLQIDLSTWETWHPISCSQGEEIGQKCFAIHTKVTMQPRFPTGTMLIIDPEVTPIESDLVLIRVGEDKISLREFVVDPPNVVLHPVIPGSESILLDVLRHRIAGVVVLTLMYPRRR